MTSPSFRAILQSSRNGPRRISTFKGVTCAYDSLMFEHLVWLADRMLLDDLVFRLEDVESDAWELDDECFRLYKNKPFLDQYARLAVFADLRPKNVVELGIWDGGSAVLWFECLRPDKLVAVDRSPRGDSRYFRRYVDRRGLGDRLKTYWGTDQGDRARLRTIVAEEFGAPLDLVIDDASHIYRPTKASFETLFPLLRPGGLYVIEDWAWGHWKDLHRPDHPLATEAAPTPLIVELVEATGSTGWLIERMTIFYGLVVVVRGDAELTDPSCFRLAQHIVRRPRSSIALTRLKRAYWAAARRLRRW